MNKRRLLAGAAGLIAIASFLAALWSRERRDSAETGTSLVNSWTAEAAEKAGRELAGGKCTGCGPALLTALPMRPDDFSMIVPYGLVVGGHVTPVDHQYFSPRDFHSPRDAYDVYAMADSRLVEIQPRTNERGTEYRLVFSVTCTFLYYYDLVTSLEPDIKSTYDKSGRGQVDIPVTAGQRIGKIGGQTLDFAVWYTEKPLKGFITPSNYDAEPWKIFTADPLDYYTPELRKFILSRYVRTADPVSGRIDYDVDGRLVGNWFMDGTNGYGGLGGPGNGNYWTGHLSFVPDLYDPTAFVVSIGDCDGQARQFAVKGNSPNPSDVSPASGVIRYDLVPWSYRKRDGTFWDRMSIAKGVKFVAHDQIQGCVLVQLVDDRILKMEYSSTPNRMQVKGFTERARTYRR